MKPESFEEKCSRQPLRQIPAAWRGKILAAVADAQTASHASRLAPHSLIATLHARLTACLWPHPKAWAGLAAAWVLILALNISAGDPAPRSARKSSPPSPELMVELKKQQRLFAELVGGHETAEADRPKVFSPKPRSECREFLAA